MFFLLLPSALYTIENNLKTDSNTILNTYVVHFDVYIIWLPTTRFHILESHSALSAQLQTPPLQWLINCWHITQHSCNILTEQKWSAEPPRQTSLSPLNGWQLYPSSCYINNLETSFVPLFLTLLSNLSANPLTFRTYPKHDHHLCSIVQSSISCVDPYNSLPSEPQLPPSPAHNLAGQSENPFKMWTGIMYLLKTLHSESQSALPAVHKTRDLSPITTLTSWLHRLWYMPLCSSHN